jgi:DedD protein
LAQDDYYYEIQLTNKQLIFYFLAGATGLVLAFLAGVMVGRGVDTSAEAQARAPVEETRIATEETPSPSPPPAQELTYAQRLESEKPEEGLVPTTRPSAPAPTPAPPTPRAAPATRAPASAAPAPAAPASPPVAQGTAPPPAVRPAPGTYAIQVGAFKDRATAESVAGRLNSRGFPAYVAAPAGGAGLFNVRVGSYRARADAERVQARLREQERFKPFLISH